MQNAIPRTQAQQYATLTMQQPHPLGWTPSNVPEVCRDMSTVVARLCCALALDNSRCCKRHNHRCTGTARCSSDLCEGQAVDPVCQQHVVQLVSCAPSNQHVHEVERLQSNLHDRMSLSVAPAPAPAYANACAAAASAAAAKLHVGTTFPRLQQCRQWTHPPHQCPADARMLPQDCTIDMDQSATLNHGAPGRQLAAWARGEAQSAPRDRRGTSRCGRTPARCPQKCSHPASKCNAGVQSRMQPAKAMQSVQNEDAVLDKL